MPGLFRHVKTNFIEKFYSYLQNNDGWHVEQPIDIEFLTEICDYNQEEHSIVLDFSTFSYDDFCSMASLARIFYHDCNDFIVRSFCFSFFSQTMTFDLYPFFM